MKFICNQLQEIDRERRRRTEAGVSHIRLSVANLATPATEGIGQALPKIEPSSIPVGSCLDAIREHAKTSDDSAMRFEIRGANPESKPPLQPTKATELKEISETDGKRSDVGELHLSESARRPRRAQGANDIRQIRGELSHETKRTLSGRFARLWSRLTGRSVSEEDGPPLIINKLEFAGAKEQLQILQTLIEKWRADSGKRTLLISSAIHNEGKSFVALNLAAACASLRTPVLLVDANLRSPSLHRVFGVSSSDGLGACLNGVREFAGCLYQTGIPGLTFIPAGDVKGSAIRLFADPRMLDFLDAARALQPSHLILIDSSAALAAPEVQILANLMDATLLVAAANRTSRSTILEVADLLKTAPLFGVVLNRFETPFSTLRTNRRASN
ncbi:MAG: CpsD/CapB family tyrosine-protein kinase [Candidatus Binataceae bacterium]|jgi:Mrp family chromosome partitioning ATPase